MKFIDQPPPFLFFTGKGGVGKTSLACATAVRFADEGKRVLLVSTDPASNVGQVFGVEIGNRITPIPAVPRLVALEIDPQAAAQAYRERIVGPVRGVLPDTVVKGIEEQLSGACTTEIAAFDEFTALLTDSALTTSYDHIIFDTAPTGHTIRLLQLPGAWSVFSKQARVMHPALARWPGSRSSVPRYKAAVDALADGARTALVLVARAQPSTLREAARTHEETGGDRPLAAASGHQRRVSCGRSRAGPAGRGDLRTRAGRAGSDARGLRALPADRVLSSRLIWWASMPCVSCWCQPRQRASMPTGKMST